MKTNTLITLIILSFSYLTFAQDEGRIKLYKERSGKEKMVKYDKIDDITLNEIEGENISYSTSSWFGEILSENEDSVFFIPYLYSHYSSYELEGVDSTSSIDLDYSYKGDITVGISKSNISSLSFTPQAKYYCWAFAYLSLTSAMVVAPLISIKQFNKGTFNTSRYVDVAKYSLLGALASFSVSFAFPTRYYTIEPQF